MAFDLSSITKGKMDRPPRVVIYGEHGLGKSTFAAGAPYPIFIPTEDGLGNLDVHAFPVAKSIDDVSEAIRSLITEDSEYKTCVIDSADWLEELIATHVAEEYSEKERSFGRDSILIADEFSKVLRGLDMLLSRGMAIVVTAHAEVKRFDDPMGESYDRYRIKLQKRNASRLQEWADIVGFASHDSMIVKDGEGFSKKNRAVETGHRVLRLSRTPAYDAKNRFGLPDELPLTWSALQTAIDTKKDSK